MNTKIFVCWEARWIQVLVYSLSGGLCYVESLVGPADYDEFIDVLLNLHTQWAGFPDAVKLTVKFIPIEESVAYEPK